ARPDDHGCVALVYLIVLRRDNEPWKVEARRTVFHGESHAQGGRVLGPIELSDMAGLDIGWAVGQELAKPGFPVPKKLQALVEAKKFGKKTGEGFYKWVKGKPQKSTSGPGTVDLKSLADRMVLPALNEAVACVRERIVADADLCDAGMVFGTGFAPHRGGPIATIRARGKQEWLRIMAELKARHGARFEPDAGWEAI